VNGLVTENRQPELTALRGLSARIGSDPLLVQASSGNTSIKLDGMLWIKASGKWLISALDPDAFVSVPLAGLRSAPAGASIETAMHAVLPHRVVLHVHSVNTIAWAVRSDGERALRDAQRLVGLSWKWIPYVASGLPLAQAIGAAVAAAPDTKVFILANHGLVVCGDDCADAEELLRNVERCLAVPPRKVARDGDSVTARILRGGILYPCQALFLGTEPPLLTDSEWDSMTDTQRSVLSGLLQVVRRIDEAAPIRYLTEADVSELLTTDAHRYPALTEKNAVAV
jgi:ribulose-5-phosphate 4-epimerase/fuculose-1-phosphate aldolase